MEAEQGMGFFGFVIAVGFFIFMSYCLKLICEKAKLDPDLDSVRANDPDGDGRGHPQGAGLARC